MPKPEGTLVAGPEAIGNWGEGLRVEGFWIELTGDLPEDAGITYQVHVQNKGWMDAVSDGTFAGTSGEGLRIESIKISLTNLDDYDVYYCGHVQNVGNIPQVDDEWGWVKNGEELGTTGDGLRLEELQIKIVHRDTDLTAYNELMDNVNNLSEDDSTPESWQALQAVIADYPITEASLQEDVDQAVAAIEEALRALDLKAVAIYDAPGIYGSEEETEIIEGSVVISVSGVTLQNLIIKGDLTIAESVGDGNATLNNLTVYGDTNINGGGADSDVSTEGILTMASSGGITINGGDYQTVIVAKIGGKLRVTMTGTAGYTYIECEEVDLILEGQFTNLMISTPDVNVELTEGSSISSLHAGFVLGENGEFVRDGSRLKVTGQGTIKNAFIASSSTDVVIDVDVTGVASIEGKNAVFNGSVNTALVDARNTTFKYEPDSYVGRYMPNIINRKTEPTTGGGVSYTAVTGVAITGETMVGQTLTATTTTAGATVSYQWMSCATIDGIYDNIASATASTYILDSEDANKYIKVQVTGSGTYNGTVTSAATGLVLNIPAVKVGNVTFTDTDTDVNEMGGTVSWTAPSDVSNVTSYMVYASSNGTTKGTSLGEVAVGTNSLIIPADTTLSAYLIVIAKNAVGEAETANYASVAVTDVVPTVPAVKVSNVTFTDSDTDANQMGGTVSWTAPGDVSNVTKYVVYTSTDGTTKSTSLGEVAVGTNQLIIPADTTLSAYLIVITKNAVGEAEAANYASLAVTDVDASYAPGSFTGASLDADGYLTIDLTGTVDNNSDFDTSKLTYSDGNGNSTSLSTYSEELDFSIFSDPTMLDPDVGCYYYDTTNKKLIIFITNSDYNALTSLAGFGVDPTDTLSAQLGWCSLAGINANVVSGVAVTIS